MIKDKFVAHLSAQRRRFRLFAPILAGARLGERLVSCLGAMLGIALTALICRSVLGQSPSLPLVVAPLGASAVLLFAVPASPLAQPWPIIGGNMISATIGVIIARIVPDQILAIGFGVSLAIAAMSFARCLHPPGGAAALTAIIGGPAITSSGFIFPLVPVGVNSVLLVALGLVFHRLARRNYPHVASPVPANLHKTTDIPSQLRANFRTEDIDKALEVSTKRMTSAQKTSKRCFARLSCRLCCVQVASFDVLTSCPATSSPSVCGTTSGSPERA